ncbi:MAG: hypothetical protein JWN14_1569 [Chthonomonadales bacterium]|nr:hypothetical protein [Chthonomonadales bacterium]
MKTIRQRPKCTGTRLHNIWRGMKQRITDVNHKDYQYNGACGVTICDEWRKDYWTFHDWAWSHRYAETLTIDRLRGGNYAPGECRWVDRATQVSNMRSNVYLTAWGETKTPAEWSRDRRAAVGDGTIQKRIARGMTGEQAVSWPSRKKWPPGDREITLIVPGVSPA